MIRQAQLESKGTRQKVLSYIGMVFRHSLQAPDWYLDTAVANFLIKCVSAYGHRHTHTHKAFNLLNIISMENRLLSISDD